MERIRAACSSEEDPYLRERLRRIFYYLLDGYLERRTAGINDEIASFEINHEVEVDAERHAYFGVPGLVADEEDSDRRDRLQAAFLRALERTNEARLRVAVTRLEILKREFGYESLTAYNAEKKSRLRASALRSAEASPSDRGGVCGLDGRLDRRRKRAMARLYRHSPLLQHEPHDGVRQVLPTERLARRL